MSNKDLTMNEEKRIITLLVNNEPGVLIRIALVFTKRGYNIDSLITHPTHNRTTSMMTITATGKSQVLMQILKQLNKLVDVIHAADHSAKSSVQLELSLIKLRFGPEHRNSILHLVNSCKATVIEVKNKSIIISCVGDDNQLNALEDIFEQYGIIEIIRTGTVLMVKGETTTA